MGLDRAQWALVALMTLHAGDMLTTAWGASTPGWHELNPVGGALQSAGGMWAMAAAKALAVCVLAGVLAYYTRSIKQDVAAHPRSRLLLECVIVTMCLVYVGVVGWNLGVALA